MELLPVILPKFIFFSSVFVDEAVKQVQLIFFSYGMQQVVRFFFFNIIFYYGVEICFTVFIVLKPTFLFLPSPCYWTQEHSVSLLSVNCPEFKLNQLKY